MTRSDSKSIHYINKGRFIQVDYNYVGVEKRKDNDRRKTLKGDPGKSESGEDRRKGARRLADVPVTLEITDEKEIYATYKVFKEIVRKTVEINFPDYDEESDQEGLITIDFGTKEVYIDCKMMHRDRMKRLMMQKGLVCRVIESGVYLGEGAKDNASQGHGPKKDKNLQAVEKDSAHAAVLGFLPENLKKETETIIFKVFVKCLNIVHPVPGDFERDALKQDVSLEQKIIFIAGKHYPKSKKYNFKTIIEQVFSEAIKEYNQMIQLDAEIIQLEERYRLSSDARLVGVIKTKKEKSVELRNSTLEETIRTLYLYLDYFKDLIKIGITKGRIENVFKKVKDKQPEVIQLEEISDQLSGILEEEKKLKKRRIENQGELLGYIKWLKNEINREVYFVRFLWINNLRGRAYIADAISRTLEAISP